MGVYKGVGLITKEGTAQLPGVRTDVRERPPTLTPKPVIGVRPK